MVNPFDDQLFVEFNGERTGPYYPASGPIPLHRYRSFKKSKKDQRVERIRSLADRLGLPLQALAGKGEVLQLPPLTAAAKLPSQPFDPDAHEYHFPNAIAAKLAIADELAKPLTKLSADDQTFIDQLLGNRCCELSQRRGWTTVGAIDRVKALKPFKTHNISSRSHNLARIYAKKPMKMRLN